MRKLASGRPAPVAFLGAMKQEVDGLRREMAIEREVAQNGWRLFQGQYGGKALLLVQTGPGRQQAEDAFEYLRLHYPLSGVVSLGFGGALQQGLRVGDLVLCSVLYRREDVRAESGCNSDRWLLDLAGEGLPGNSVRVGTGVTVPTLVRQRGERMALRDAFGADVVDMESYWVGVLARTMGIPFLAVRAISDSVNDSLPPFDLFFGPEGRWRWREGLGHFLSHPSDLSMLPGVYANSRRAAGSLTGLLKTMISRF